MEIKPEKAELWRCPVCNHVYNSQEIAEECLNMAIFRRDFMEQDRLWRWNLVANQYKACLLLPCKIEATYTCVDSNPCINKNISLFNSYSNEYMDISGWLEDKASLGYAVKIAQKTWSLEEAWNLWHIAPPAKHIRNAPEEIMDIMSKIADKTIKFREEEVRAYAASPVPENLREKWDIYKKSHTGMEIEKLVHWIANAELYDCFPDIEVEEIPTQIISGEKLFRIDDKLVEKMLA